MKPTLPLLYKTPDRWAAGALQDVPALLSDHAYLERKAASNALELLNRWPEPHCPPEWTKNLASIAKDEALHLDMVLTQIRKRGGKLQRLHKSRYANDLRALVRKGHGPREILDRLLISALIEARSCERFEILSRQSADKELTRFYKGLCTSEYGHHHVFLNLAAEIGLNGEHEARWAELLKAEAYVIANQPTGSCLHSGL